MPTYTISDAAERTGFSASTLRYYERVGLVVPERNGAGYRLYDDLQLARLRFVDRAKRLGLTLDEITGLLQAWDGEPCTHVAELLRQRVIARLGAVRERSQDLATLERHLEDAAEELAQSVDPGPCGDSCSCHGRPDHHPTATSEDPAGLQPIACSLESRDQPDRVSAWQQVRRQAASCDTAVGARRLRFPPGAKLAAQVAQLAASEQDCCGFFEFTLRIESQGTELEVRAPADAEPFLAALFDPPPSHRARQSAAGPA